MKTEKKLYFYNKDTNNDIAELGKYYTRHLIDKLLCQIYQLDNEEEYREKFGQMLSDYFNNLDNGDGTLAFDHCSAEDIDRLVNHILYTPIM